MEPIADANYIASEELESALGQQWTSAPCHEGPLSSPITLTAIKFTILKGFPTRPGIVLTREQIMNAVYDIQIYVSDRTIDSHIRNIRAKFAAAGCASIIDTVHGVDFKLGLCEAAK
jgi:DNA-binding response OmpR family regulator